MNLNLSYEQYSALGYDEAKEDEFTQVARKAQRAIDGITDYFYRDHALADDPIESRVEAYRMAICEQIDFIQATGVASSYENGEDFKQVTIGRLSLQPASTLSSDSLVNGVCKEAYRLLAHVGLLYRGRGSEPCYGFPSDYVTK